MAPRRPPPRGSTPDPGSSRLEEHSRRCPGPTLANAADPARRHSEVSAGRSDHTIPALDFGRTDTTTASAAASKSTPSITVDVSPHALSLARAAHPVLPPDFVPSDSSKPRERTGCATDHPQRPPTHQAGAPVFRRTRRPSTPWSADRSPSRSVGSCGGSDPRAPGGCDPHEAP